MRPLSAALFAVTVVLAAAFVAGLVANNRSDRVAGIAAWVFLVALGAQAPLALVVALGVGAS